MLVEEHGMEWSYTFVKNALQAAGLIRKYKKRGRHHRRREPKACFGEMLHIDGSKHPWLALVPEQVQILVVVLDEMQRNGSISKAGGYFSTAGFSDSGATMWMQ